MIYGTPIAILVFLVLFAGILLPWQARSTTDLGGDTKEHSERIYKDFEMYLKVTLGLVAAFGYIRIDRYTAQPDLARQALQAVGGISLLVMTTFCIFVLCHQASKVRRWEKIEWGKTVFWQELWACLAMWLFSSGVWVAAHVW
ncbi:MAG: hypothetical protein WCZ86_14575 [Desulfurivibrionaceae bacterium]|jgi:hypothetical protein